MARFNSILDTIGDTPLVRLNRLAPAGVNLYVKVESFNPMGSVKDRMARAVIEAAEQSGELKPGQTVIEATSGNTGIGLAMVCARKGYPLVVTMAENFSVERRKLLRFLGARVVLTPAAEKGTGMLAKAVELADKHGYYLCRQFDNPANAEVHYQTTAREILNDMAGETIDYWVSGFGTGGTLNGVSRRLREASPGTRIIVAEPDNSPILGSGIPQPRDAGGDYRGSHPSFRPHLMQGWSPDFISTLTEQAVDTGLIDEVVPVSGDEALRLSRQLAQKEGIFVGISAGATLAGAIEVAKRAPQGSNIVCMLPDTGERYLSTPLFADISEHMTEAEIALSESTPGYRFATGVASKPDIRTGAIVVDSKVDDLVGELIDQEPVLMFALEWCEFCWSVRKLFARFDIPCHSVDLDSVACQKDDLGGKIRDVLERRLGVRTIPQIFIGGTHIGGCTELFEMVLDGRFEEALAGIGIPCRIPTDFDARSFLPQWVQPRKIVERS